MAVRRALALLTLAVPLATLACADTMPPHRLDRTTLTPSFDESFDHPPAFLDAELGRAGRWKTNYFFGEQDADQPKGWESRTLSPNGEQQYYGRPSDTPSPFQWKDGILSIVAQPRLDLGNPRMHALPFLSGLITTEKSYSQATGYFEARIALPQGKGLWPAFWLLPNPKVENGRPTHPGGQEIDIFEAIGEPGRIYHTVFTDRGGEKIRNASAFDTHTDLTRFHTYGVLVTPTQIVWYFDDVEVRRVANADFDRPAYMLLNLAVGGDWPGAPDANTRFPAAMRIDWVRAFRLKGAAR